MSIETWGLYLLTVVALTISPGPGQILMLSNSSMHGFGRSLATAAGDLSANVLQMIAAGLGLAAVLSASTTALSAVKWAGIAYLVFLGCNMIRRTGSDLASAPDQRQAASLRSLTAQGFFTSASNPKEIVFFTSLFPHFIDVETEFWPQFLILSSTYIIADGLLLAVYGLGSRWLVARFGDNPDIWVARIGGAFMIGAAALLGLRSFFAS